MAEKSNLRKGIPADTPGDVSGCKIKYVCKLENSVLEAPDISTGSVPDNLSEHSHTQEVVGINPISYGLSDSLAPMGGGASEALPPKILKKESSLTPCLFVYLGVTCKNSDRNLKI